jgi:hypothetical protein
MRLSTRAVASAAVLAMGAGGGAYYWSSQPGPGPAASAPVYAWVQLEAGSGASVRAVMPATAASCPTLTVDGAATAMSKRGPSPSGLSTVFVCEHPLSSPTKTLAIGALKLPAPTGAANKALVLGDTGCRAKKGMTPQSCTGDPAQGAWGFPALSKAAASSSPDFVLHVGDYLYRESCATGCGFNWSTWEADFFAPAESGGLLRMAPWVLVRGNHEDCHRAWAGYSLFFAPGPMSAAGCPSSISPYGVTLNGLTLYVTDTSSDDPQQAQTDFATVKSQIGSSSTAAWLATHVPVCSDDQCNGGMGLAFQAAGLDKVAAVKWLHVGHVHLFDHTAAGAHHPAQTVSGGGGTALDCTSASHCIDSNTKDCISTACAPPCVAGDTTSCPPHHYTYMTVSTQASSWDATVYDQSGNDLKIPFSVSR